MSRSPSRGELVLVSGFLVAGTVETVLRDRGSTAWLATGISAIGGLALLLVRRTRPLLALTAFVAGAAVMTWIQTLLPDPTARRTGAFVPIIALVVLCYSLGAHGGRRSLLLGAPLPVALVALVDLLQPSAGSLGAGLAFFTLFVVVAPALAGRLVRSRRTLLGRLHELEEQAARAHATRLEAVRTTESLAVASELDGTLAAGLRRLRHLQQAAGMEALARELLGTTRDVVVDLSRQPPAAPDASGPSPTPGPAQETVTGWTVLAAAGVGTGLLVETLPQWHDTALGLLLTAAVVAGLAGIARAPLAGLSLAWVGAALLDARVTPLEGTLTAIGLLVAGTFLCCWLAGPREAVATCVVGLAAGVLLPVGDPAAAVVFVGLAAVAGRTLRSHAALLRQLVAARTEAAGQRAAELDLGALQARAALAREVHDTVGHGLTIVALQAAAARRLADKDPAASAEAVRVLREVVDRTLLELESGFSRTPPAALLVSRARELGMPVHLDGTWPTGAAGEVLDRVVQEALTNAMRHAPGADVHLAVSEDPAGQVRCVVTNGPPAAPGSGHPGGGRGLPGIVERVRAAGGTVEWGSTPDGGFALAVVLPTRQEEPAT